MKDLYYKCAGCGTINATQSIDHLVETENDNSATRSAQNSARIERVLKHIKPNLVIDFGCGNGQLTCALEEKGIYCMGIDQDTETKLGDLIFGIYDGAFMVEVIEHLTNPKEVLRELTRVLNPGGILYIETTFADDLGENWREHPYVDPKIGHRTILSKAALRAILPPDLEELEWVDSNTVLLRKTESREARANT